MIYEGEPSTLYIAKRHRYVVTKNPCNEKMKHILERR